jgi:hypothetical protein
MRNEIFRTACLKVLPQAQKIGGKRLASKILMLANYAGNQLVPLKKEHAIKYRGIGFDAIHAMQELGLVETDQFMELNELRSQTRNILVSLGITNKKKASAAIASGKLGRRVRNYGVKSHEEVCKWLGVKESAK